ncbi:hypothetical protein GCM10022251_30090 [Phytohabitans flavus]|uniref:Uncharacterized protein n=1 Tax=Phytohabitans flavus TaxID=1076124 RepID=A0A6F8XXE4_9ACTN|nr:hypothetical protein [Phytohabitans flavus]BCB78408.1 hypothetical protein Pflav_048180 [Phytohabitans flavus]
MRIALLVVRCAAALLPDRTRRDRYREQWEADVRGAAELELSPLRLALGMAGAAVLITFTSTKGTRMTPIGPLALAMRLVGGDVRRRAAALAALSALALAGGLLLLITG